MQSPLPPVLIPQASAGLGKVWGSDEGAEAGDGAVLGAQPGQALGPAPAGMSCLTLGTSPVLAQNGHGTQNATNTS